MRLLSALRHEDIEEYIRYLPGIEVLNIVENKRSLLDALSSGKYDLVMISKDLPGSEEMDLLIEVLVSEEFKGQRVVYLYGEYDSYCDEFIKFLFNHGIYDFYVGEEITSKDIERLIFKPAGRERALCYYKSHYDNELNTVFAGQKNKNKRLFKGKSLINFGFGSLLKINDMRNPLERLIISIISNQATGKSHTAWNLSYCFSKLGYATSLINIDRGYSANLFFDIDEVYYNLLDFTIKNNMYKDILDNCFRRRNLSVITGKLGVEEEIGSEDFLKLLYCIRTKSDITIIDTRTGLSELTRLSIKNSIYDLLVFDCDIMHFHMNMSMLEELKDDFVPEKTIALINNTNVRSSSHKFIYNELINSGISFKDIAFISSCGFIGYELMHTGLTPYQALPSVIHIYVETCKNTVPYM
jgi:cellulose biosynthesis protein BcsQ